MRDLLAKNNLLIDGISYDTFTPPCLLACIDGQPVGMVQAILGKPYSVMSEVAVARDYQDKGIGSQLLHAMECLLKGMGYPTWIGFVGQHRDQVQAKLDHYGARCLGPGLAYMRTLPQ